VRKAAVEIVSGSLDGIEIFQGLTPAARQTLGNRCAWREYGPKQLIVGHEEPSRTVFFLVTGRVRVSVYSSTGKRVTYTDIDAGEMFGEFAAIDGEPRSASVEATHTSLIASMSPDLFWEMLHSHPEVNEAVLRRLTRKARSLSRQLYEFSTLSARDRLRLELLRLASGSLNEKDTAIVKDAPTHEDLATRIGSQRETVSREMAELATMGIIEQERRILTIKNVSALRRLVDEALDG
jgi:CRP-like cAMP-binding protein